MGTFSFPERVTGAIGVAPVEERLDVTLVCVENCLGRAGTGILCSCLVRCGNGMEQAEHEGWKVTPILNMPENNADICG